MKSGIKLISETCGDGEDIERKKTYLMQLKFWLNKGESITWDTPWGLIDRAKLLDEGKTLVTDLRVDRESMINGLFYGIQGMKVGGTRKLKISPHLAYGEAGVRGVIPENAVLLVEVLILEERQFA